MNRRQSRALIVGLALLAPAAMVMPAVAQMRVPPRISSDVANVQVAIWVTDTQTGTVRSYWNAQEDAFQPVQDTDAFASCS
jgi:hypothetical protein